MLRPTQRYKKGGLDPTNWCTQRSSVLCKWEIDNEILKFSSKFRRKEKKMFLHTETMYGKQRLRQKQTKQYRMNESNDQVVFETAMPNLLSENNLILMLSG